MYLMNQQITVCLTFILFNSPTIQIINTWEILFCQTDICDKEGKVTLPTQTEWQLHSPALEISLHWCKSIDSWTLGTPEYIKIVFKIEWICSELRYLITCLANRYNRNNYTSLFCQNEKIFKIILVRKNVKEWNVWEIRNELCYAVHKTTQINLRDYDRKYQ